MDRTIVVLSLLSLLGIATGCATAMFNVTSDPLQADVYFQVPGAPDKKPLGKTPLTMTNAELKSALGPELSSGEYFPLTVEKDGFKKETFQVPASRFGTMLTKLDVKLKAVDPNESPKGQEKTAKSMVDRLFLAQKFALTQQFERAHAELDRLLIDFPQFARALSMRASIYYAQKNVPDALKWYEEALKADPQMEEAVRMTAKIRGVPSGRLPANDPAAPKAAPTAPNGGTK